MRVLRRFRKDMGTLTYTLADAPICAPWLLDALVTRVKVVPRLHPESGHRTLTLIIVIARVAQSVNRAAMKGH